MFRIIRSRVAFESPATTAARIPVGCVVGPGSPYMPSLASTFDLVSISSHSRWAVPMTLSCASSSSGSHGRRQPNCISQFSYGRSNRTFWHS